MSTPTLTTCPASEVARLIKEGRPIDLIDVRTPVEYAAVHAKGATSIPLDRLDPAKVLAGRKGAASDPIYLICKAGKRGAIACEKFLAAGHANVVNVEGGTDAWVAAGLPVVRGASGVISLERQVRIGAGLLTLAGAVLALTVHVGFAAIPAFIGAGLIFAGVTDWCGMGLLLAKAPWNRRAAANAGACCSA